MVIPAPRCGAAHRCAEGGGLGAPIGANRPLRQAPSQSSPETNWCCGIRVGGGEDRETAAVGGCCTAGVVLVFQMAAWALSHAASTVSRLSMFTGTPVC